MSNKESIDAILSLKEIFSKISGDVGTYISLIVLLGYILITVQQCTRYAYYRVDPVYLFDIRLSDVFLGSLYIVVMSIYIYFIHETVSNRLQDIWSHIFVLIGAFSCICLVAYALALKWSLTTIIFVTVIIPIIVEIFMYALYEFPFVRKLLGCEDKTGKIFIANIVLILMLLACVFQWMADTTNYRFTYVEIPIYENVCCEDCMTTYVVVTSFKDSLILKEAVINEEDRSIIIKLDSLRLYPVSKCIIKEMYFSRKTLTRD